MSLSFKRLILVASLLCLTVSFATPASARTASRAAPKGNNTVPILVAFLETRDCQVAARLGVRKTLAEIGRRSVAEYVVSCVSDRRPDLDFFTSDSPDDIRNGVPYDAAQAIAALARRYDHHAVILIGQGSARRAALKTMLALPSWVRVQQLALLP